MISVDCRLIETFAYRTVAAQVNVEAIGILLETAQDQRLILCAMHSELRCYRVIHADHIEHTYSHHDTIPIPSFRISLSELSYCCAGPKRSCRTARLR